MIQIVNCIVNFFIETIAAEAVCSGEESGAEEDYQDQDYQNYQDYQDYQDQDYQDYQDQGSSDDYYFEEGGGESSFASSTSSAYSSSFSSATSPPLTSSRPIPRPSILDNSVRTLTNLSASSLENLVPTYLSPGGREGTSQGGKSRRRPATRFENLLLPRNNEKQQSRNFSPNFLAKPGQTIGKKAPTPELLRITDGLARPKSKTRKGKAFFQKGAKVKQGKRPPSRTPFPPKTEDIERLRKWSSWPGSISTTVRPRVGRVQREREEKKELEEETSSSFPALRLPVPSETSPSRPKAPSDFPTTKPFRGRGLKKGLQLENRESEDNQFIASNSKGKQLQKQHNKARKLFDAVFHNSRAKKKSKSRRRKKKFDGTITTSAPPFSQSRVENKTSQIKLSGFSVEGTRGQAQLKSFRPEKKRERGKGNFRNGSGRQQNSVDSKTMSTKNAVLPSTPRFNRTRGGRENRTILLEELPNNRLRANVPKKSKAEKAISPRSSKARSGVGRLGKALRKEVVGKAVWTVEEWLRRG